MRTVVKRHFTHSGPRSDLTLTLGLALLFGLLGCVSILGCGSSGSGPSNDELVAQGKQIFRFETFGDETKWTDTLHLNDAAVVQHYFFIPLCFVNTCARGA